MIATMAAEKLVAPVANNIRSMAAQAESERRLPKDLFALLMESGLFSNTRPRSSEGLTCHCPRRWEWLRRCRGTTAPRGGRSRWASPTDILHPCSPEPPRPGYLAMARH
jgi:hypothetical protein